MSICLGVHEQPERKVLDVIQEVEMTSEEQGQREETEDGAAKSGDVGRANKRNADSMAFRPAPLEITEHIKVDVLPQCPASTSDSVSMSSSTNLSVSEEELRKAEGTMTKAFIEFYNKLHLLKSYW